MMAALARPPLARLLRLPRGRLVTLAWCVLALGFAAAERIGGSAHGADHVLVGAYGALILPLLAYTIVGAVVGPRSIATSIAPLVAFGASRSRAAAASIGVAVAASVVTGGVVAALVAVLAHGHADPPIAADALESAYVGALGGAAYAAWFALGSALGKRGGWRTTLLVADWLLGGGRGPVALVTPRAHVRSLLGGIAPVGWSGRASAVALVVLFCVCALLAWARSRTPPT